MSNLSHVLRRVAGVVALAGLLGMVAAPAAFAQKTTQEGKCSIRSNAAAPCVGDRGKEASAQATGKGVHDTCTEAKRRAQGILQTKVSKPECMKYQDCSRPCRTIN